jgi:hypothetical protein
VSETKVVVLSLCTLGLYQYYWFYRNWRMVRDQTSANIFPFWRSFFAVFFCYSLFKHIRGYNDDLPSSNMAAGPLAAVWIVLSLLWKLPDPYWLVSLMPVFVLVPVQRVINGINAVVAPNHEPNSRFSVWNWITVLFGGPFLVLAVYGTLLPLGGNPFI